MKAKTLFYCTECGNETPKWQGKCSACGAWNTIVERPSDTAKPYTAKGASGRISGLSRPKTLYEVEATAELRFETGMKELDLSLIHI